MTGPRVAAVLWDADGVLQQGEEDWRGSDEALSTLDDDFLAEALAEERSFMAGGDFPAALAAVAERHRVAVPVETLLAPWRSIEALPDTWDLLAQVRSAGVPCYLATNQQAYRGAHMQATLGYADRLDGAFYSYQLGLAKPDPGYFTAILDRLRLPGHRVLFVDDRHDNVEGAREAGLHAEVWSADEPLHVLRGHLARHGLPLT